MCGGLVTTISHSRRSVIRYHLGRLLGYCALGALAGAIGETVFQNQAFTLVPWLSTFTFAISFIFIGIRLWQGKPLHLFNINPFYWKKFSQLGPETLGLLSAFLPCGWLHTFVLGAVATQSAGLGALYLFFFWLGTLPALTAGPLAAHALFKPLARRAPKTSAALLITIGLGSIGAKMIPVKSVGGCHHSSPSTETTDRPHSQHESEHTGHLRHATHADSKASEMTH